MRHILSGISIYGLNGLEKGDEHPTYTLIDVINVYRLFIKK